MSTKRYEEFRELIEALDFVAHLRIQGFSPQWVKINTRNTWFVCWEIETRRNSTGS